MAYTDLTVDNGWIPVQTLPQGLLRDVETSAVESAAATFNMTSDQAKVPTFIANGVSVVAEGAEIPLRSATLDKVILDAHKWADRYAQSSEDTEDAIADGFAAYRREWLSNFAISFDNACLGVTGTGGPYESVYRAVGAGRRLATAGALTYEHVQDVVGEMEGNRKGGLVIIAHPKFKMDLRNLKDVDGNRVYDNPLGAEVPTLFGHEVRYSYGAATSAAFSDAPAGNPLLVVANKSNLIVGKRTGPDFKVSDEAQWANDNIELKMRARRAFLLADASGARVIEKTAGA